MSQIIPNITKDKSFVGKKLFMYSDTEAPMLRSGTMKASELASASMAMGQVVAKETSSGKIIKYVSGGSGGAEIAVGILSEQVDYTTIGSTPMDVIVQYCYRGVVYEAQCIDLDADAKTDLKNISFI
jgi:hypothetical protein